MVDYQLCCGCGLCAYLHPNEIRMVDAPSVGRRPIFFNSSEQICDFQLALELCPGAGLSCPPNLLSRTNQIESLTSKWGPVLEIWEGYAADPRIRFKGSSGGAITAICTFCLEHEQMKGVLHVKADSNAPHLNTTVLSNTRMSLLEGTGSRYSPASPCERLDEIENLSGLGVIVGKPCDIAAVNKARKFREPLDRNIGLTIACFCAGTPCTNGTLEMLRQMGVADPFRLTKLRYRGNGWPGQTRAEYNLDQKGQAVHEWSYEQSWGGVLEKYRQWRCYICPDHTGEFADIAVGDPWYREITKESLGNSLLLVRSERGKEIVYRAIEQKYLIAEKRPAMVLSASQKNLEHARARLWGQLLALKLANVPCPKFDGFCLYANWRDGLSLAEKTRSILGTLKRVYVKNLKKRQEMNLSLL